MSDRAPLWRRLLRRERPQPSAFITGDASGAVIEDVVTSAGDFVRGSTEGSVIRNVVHERPEP